MANATPGVAPRAQASEPVDAPILVLEDDPLQLRILVDHLRSQDFEVTTATTLAEARKLLAARPPRLAIVDVHLPDGSGFDLCEQIDDDPHLAGLPVIVLSSLRQSDAVRQTRAAGGRYFISKPYDPNVLLAILERALDGGDF